jgi:hypothetical protein
MVIRIQRNNAYQLKKPETKAPEKEWVPKVAIDP